MRGRGRVLADREVQVDARVHPEWMHREVGEVRRHWHPQLVEPTQLAEHQRRERVGRDHHVGLGGHDGPTDRTSGEDAAEEHVQAPEGRAGRSEELVAEVVRPRAATQLELVGPPQELAQPEGQQPQEIDDLEVMSRDGSSVGRVQPPPDHGPRPSRRRRSTRLSAHASVARCRCGPEKLGWPGPQMCPPAAAERIAGLGPASEAPTRRICRARGTGVRLRPARPAGGARRPARHPSFKVPDR